MKRILRAFLALLGTLVLGAFLLVLFNDQVRISLLYTLTPNYCENVSSDGNWLACKVTLKEVYDDQFYIDFYSTHFPFRKVRVLLPSVVPYDGGFFEEYVGNPMWLGNWSPTGSTALLKYFSFKKPENEKVCFVQIERNGQYQVNCIKRGRNWDHSRCEWSIKENTCLIPVGHPDGSFDMTMLDQAANVAGQFTTPVLLDPEEGQEVKDWDVLWNSTDMYLTAWYGKIPDSGGAIPPINRTEILRFSVDRPDQVSKVVERDGEFALISIDPEGKYLLLGDETHPLLEDKLQLVDSVQGNLVREISLAPNNAQEVIVQSVHCLYNCSKTAISYYVGEIRQIFVWTWDTLNYKVYEDHDSIFGRINHLDGFFCLSPEYLPYNKFNRRMIWINVCR